MKTMRARHRLTVVLSVLAVVAVGGGLGVSVFCVGPDGHFGVESLFEECCLLGEVSGGAGEAAAVFSGHDCGDCVDVLLKTAPLPPRNVDFPGPSIAIFDRPVCGSISNCGVDATTTESSDPGLDLVAVTTVVLLT